MAQGTVAALPPLHVVGHLHRYPAGGEGLDGLEGRVRRIAEEGFAGVRLGFEWSRVERSPGRQTWEDIDATVDLLRAYGLRAYGLLTYSPSWARPPGARPSHRPMVGASTSAGDSAFAAFAAEAAARYSGTIDSWEIWNEPNILQFWSHLEDGVEAGPDPADYLSLFVSARDAILDANPEALVITGGLAAGPSEATFRARMLAGRSTGYPAARFLEGLLELDLRPSAVGLHPYLPPGEVRGEASGHSVNPRLAEVEDVLDRYGLHDTGIYVTEWGIDATHVEPGAAGAWFRSGLGVLCRSPRVRLLTIYALTDWGEQGRYALLDSGGEATEAGSALRGLLSAGGTCP